MAVNYVQNAGENQYPNSQIIKSPKAEQAAVEQQNQKAAETDLNKQAADRVQEAFKLDISKEGQAMLAASDTIEQGQGNGQNKEIIEPEGSEQMQAPYNDQETRQIVNIIA